MNCRRVLAALPLHVGGDLDPARAAAVDEHLAVCEACAAERAEYERSRQSLFALKGEPRPDAPDLWPGVRLRLGEAPRPRIAFPLRAAAALLFVAAGAAALVFGFGAGGDAVDPRPETPIVAEQASPEAEVPAAVPAAPAATLMPPGSGDYVLAEVGPDVDDVTGDLPSVVPAVPERTGWDEF
jgi:anti-sigma factor RsiW